MLLLSFPCLHNPEKFWDKQVSSFFLGAINSKDRDLSQDSCIEHLYSEKGREFRHSCIYVSCLESSRSCFGCSFRCPSLLLGIHKGQSWGWSAAVGVTIRSSGSLAVQRCRARLCVCVCVSLPCQAPASTTKGREGQLRHFLILFFHKELGKCVHGQGVWRRGNSLRNMIELGRHTWEQDKADISKKSLISLSQLKPLCFFTEQKKSVSEDPVKGFSVKKAKYKSLIYNEKIKN